MKITLLFVHLLFCSLIHAQWRSITGPGLQTIFVQQHKSTIFAGGHGLFRTTDGGENWTQCKIDDNYNLIENIFCLDSVIFVVTVTGMLRSEDDGKTWTIDPSFYQSGFSSIVSNRGIYYGGSIKGLFKSDDRGKTWKLITNTINAQSISSICIVDSALFVGTYIGVYKSIDWGSKWSYVSTGIGDKFVRRLVYSNSKLYAGTEKNGVFVSEDGANSWQPINTGLDSLHIFDMECLDSVIYIGTKTGLYSLNPGDSSWSKNAFTNWIKNIDVKGDNLYAVSGTFPADPYISANKGKDWTLLLPDYGYQSSLNKIRVFNKRIYMLTKNGVFVSYGGNSDQPDFRLFSKITGSNDIAIKDNKIFISSVDSGLCISSDSGYSWQSLKNVPDAYKISCMEVIGNNIAIGTPAGVYLSDDNGSTWISANLGINNSDSIVRQFHKNNSAVYIIKDKLYVSADFGSTWRGINIKDEYGSPLLPRTVTTIENKVVIGTETGIYVSENSGNTWVKSNYNYSVLEIQTVDSVLFARMLNPGMYTSSDHGYTWNIQNNGYNPYVNNSFSSKGICVWNHNILSASEHGIWMRDISEMVQSITGLNETPIANDQIQVYPNPSHHLIVIAGNNLSTNDYSIQIFDLMGKEVKGIEPQWLSRTATLNIEGIPAGTYFIRIHDKNGDAFSRFIKN